MREMRTPNKEHRLTNEEDFVDVNSIDTFLKKNIPVRPPYETCKSLRRTGTSTVYSFFGSVRTLIFFIFPHILLYAAYTVA